MVATTQMQTVVSQAMRESGTGVWWRTPVTAALTPELAIAYVRELSADVRGVVVLAADGTLLAGRTEEHAIVVSAGPLSLVGPTARDARAAVSALAGRAAGTPVSGTMKT